MVVLAEPGQVGVGLEVVPGHEALVDQLLLLALGVERRGGGERETQSEGDQANSQIRHGLLLPGGDITGPWR